jgi:hypothetical protein
LSGDAEEQKRAKEREREENKLWKQMIKQNEYVVQEFFTAVIGIGALFFAYGSLHSYGYIAIAVAMVGLGASIVVWMHEFGAHKEMLAIQDELGDTELMTRWKKTLGWRDKFPYNLFYHPSTRLMTYFSALVALTWSLLIFDDFLYNLGQTPSRLPFVAVGIFGIVVVLVMVFIRKGQDLERHKKQRSLLNSEYVGG